MHSPSSGERTGRSPNRSISVGSYPMIDGGWTAIRAAYEGCYRVTNHARSRTLLERVARDGESPVDETGMARRWYVSTTGHEKPCGKLVRPRTKAKYARRPIVN